MLAQNGGASSNAEAIELLRTDIRERIGSLIVRNT
jgi:hypothetical protein